METFTSREVKFYLTCKHYFNESYIPDYDKEFIMAMGEEMCKQNPDESEHIRAELDKLPSYVLSPSKTNMPDYLQQIQPLTTMILQFIYNGCNYGTNSTVIKILESLPKCDNPRLKTATLNPDQDVKIFRDLAIGPYREIAVICSKKSNIYF